MGARKALRRGGSGRRSGKRVGGNNSFLVHYQRGNAEKRKGSRKQKDFDA